MWYSMLDLLSDWIVWLPGTIHGEADVIRFAAVISAEIAIDMKL